ncbi:phage tail fiber C-terminal domain-containing protein, partial [Escherichia coli]|uniref:phage tail fiber C-terminal domain-containing protein n=1 Tax=Escherichia coli TaxID=562 RepID=UPI0020248649
DCWKGWAIFLRQKQKKLIMLPSEIMIWQPEFTDKILSRKPGAVQGFFQHLQVRFGDGPWQDVKGLDEVGSDTGRTGE